MKYVPKQYWCINFNWCHWFLHSKVLCLFGNIYQITLISVLNIRQPNSVQKFEVYSHTRNHPDIFQIISTYRFLCNLLQQRLQINIWKIHLICAFLKRFTEIIMNLCIDFTEFTSSVISVLVHPSRSHCILVVCMDSIASFWEYLSLEHRWVKQCQFQLSNAKGAQVISVVLQVCSFSLFWCENRSASGLGLSSCCVCRRQLVSSWDSSLPEQLGQVDAVLHSCPVVSLFTVKRELCIVPSLPHKQQMLLFWSFIHRTFKVRSICRKCYIQHVKHIFQ